MRDALTQKSDGFMPRSIAITLLTSPQSKTASFRKRCYRAMEREVEPTSRSTRFTTNVPKTGSQKLQSRLSKANAKQLLTWQKRTLRRGERYQDQLFETQMRMTTATVEEMDELYEAEKMLVKQIAAHDALCEAIHNELTRRRQRGIGYCEPIKWAGRLIAS